MIDTRYSRFFRGLVTVGLSLTMTGCVVALNPLFHADDLVSDSRLVGHWIDEDGAEWHFAPADDQSYELTFRSEQAKPRTIERHPSPLEARLVEIGDHRFLDLTVDPKADVNSLFDLHLLPVHSIWRIVIGEDSMTLESLESSWIKEAASAGRPWAGFVEVDGWRVLTGTTDELQVLVQAIVESGEGLDEPGVLRRFVPEQGTADQTPTER